MMGTANNARSMLRAFFLTFFLSGSSHAYISLVPGNRLTTTFSISTRTAWQQREIHFQSASFASKQDISRLPTSLKASLQAASNDSSSETNSKVPTLVKDAQKSIVSAAAFVVLDIVFRRGFLRANISFPSSLAGCGALFATLLALPEKQAESWFQQLEPGANLLAKWLPVFFVPSLVTLPLADSIGSAAEIFKVGVVVVGGFLFTLLTTAWSVVAVRKFRSDNKDSEDKTTEPTEDVEEATQEDAKAPNAFSEELFQGLVALTAASGVGAFLTAQGILTSMATPLQTLFMLSATLGSFVFGARLPKTFTKVVHPLVTCTTLTWTAATAFATITGNTFKSMLKSYTTGTLAPARTGAGDILLSLLGPAVVSLAISMYSRRKLMKENLAEVGTAIMVSTMGGLFGTAAAVRLLDIGSPTLRLSLLSRNITSPLAMAIASIVGADASLAVSIVVITGLIGANFGASILDAFGIKDGVARGLAIGAAAHGLGTAAFVDEKDAFPFAAIAMALTASAATVTVSIPPLRRLILQLALGW